MVPCLSCSSIPSWVNRGRGGGIYTTQKIQVRRKKEGTRIWIFVARFGVSMVETDGPFFADEFRYDQASPSGGFKYGLFNHTDLVGGLEHGFYFSIQLGMSSPQLTHIFQRGWNHQPESYACRHPAKIKKELYVAMHKIYGSKDRTVKKSLFQEGFTFHDCSIFLGITGELFGGIVRSVVRGHNSLERFDKKSSYYCR